MCWSVVDVGCTSKRLLCFIIIYICVTAFLRPAHCLLCDGPRDLWVLPSDPTLLGSGLIHIHRSRHHSVLTIFSTPFKTFWNFLLNPRFSLLSLVTCLSDVRLDLSTQISWLIYLDISYILSIWSYQRWVSHSSRIRLIWLIMFGKFVSVRVVLVQWRGALNH